MSNKIRVFSERFGDPARSRLKNACCRSTFDSNSASASCHCCPLISRNFSIFYVLYKCSSQNIPPKGFNRFILRKIVIERILVTRPSTPESRCPLIVASKGVEHQRQEAHHAAARCRKPLKKMLLDR
jgi:hypothetical protein